MRWSAATSSRTGGGPIRSVGATPTARDSMERALRKVSDRETRPLPVPSSAQSLVPEPNTSRCTCPGASRARASDSQRNRISALVLRRIPRSYAVTSGRTPIRRRTTRPRQPNPAGSPTPWVKLSPKKQICTCNLPAPCPSHPSPAYEPSARHLPPHQPEYRPLPPVCSQTGPCHPDRTRPLQYGRQPAICHALAHVATQLVMTAMAVAKGSYRKPPAILCEPPAQHMLSG